ncbi:NAD-dependent epimerase/dehydratase family protein [Tenacibaculum jejuense]|uniref:Protein CapI n=1 Tax=Tenacibaculum jejuense TaxID=584609 RepID=A0A238U6V7_9FLAO|nr:NAD-dependent epimerase/dehydratase family protein [Tenacibaculum jejuense]SNR14887.1 Protein CapI [Tenacibaculum jejuense]
MKILVTGAAGFIGFHLTKSLLELGHTVVGIDNINDYYDVNLKYDRLKELGILEGSSSKFHHACYSEIFPSLSFVRMNLEDGNKLEVLFKENNFNVVCNLAAQAGVRYSIQNPRAYIDSNIVGFLNILECCRCNKIDHLVYASSSSVYGMNSKIPFSEEDQVDSPVSLYAATKKSNELMAHSYSNLYNLTTTALRFFTVYGPWGRPDMAPMLFAEAINKNEHIKVFNHGDMERDFTYIDDIVKGIVKVIENPIRRRKKYEVYNIGNNKTVKLTDFIGELELNFNRKVEKHLLPMQLGDVKKTWANVDKLMKDYNYKPSTTVKKGVLEFVNWFIGYKN